MFQVFAKPQENSDIISRTEPVSAKDDKNDEPDFDEFLTDVDLANLADRLEEHLVFPQATQAPSLEDGKDGKDGVPGPPGPPGLRGPPGRDVSILKIIKSIKPKSETQPTLSENFQSVFDIQKFKENFLRREVSRVKKDVELAEQARKILKSSKSKQSSGYSKQKQYSEYDGDYDFGYNNYESDNTLAFAGRNSFSLSVSEREFANENFIFCLKYLR